MGTAATKPEDICEKPNREGTDTAWPTEHFQSSGGISSGSFSLLSIVDSQISRRDPGEVKSELWTCVPPGSAVPRVSPATGVGQGERTMQELKETFIFIGKRRGGHSTQREEPANRCGRQKRQQVGCLTSYSCPERSVGIQFFFCTGVNSLIFLL